MKKGSERGWSWFACVLFLVCTFVFLYPYSFDPAHTVSDAGDPLLNISTLWRVQQHLAKGEIRDLYEADYFYPRENVLAYSEIMLPTAIISWPIAAISGNPVLSYNFSFLLAYFLTALFTFLLVKRLTGSPVAGIVSGLLFAFCQWRLHRPAQMQLLTAYWTPLAFIYLHKYWADRKTKDIALAAVFFSLQVLSCIYLGLIFAVGIGIFLLLMSVSHCRGDYVAAKDKAVSTRPAVLGLLMRDVVRPVGAFCVVCAALLILPLLPYSQVSTSLGKARWGAEGADLLSYVLLSQILFVSIPVMFLLPWGIWVWRRHVAKPQQKGTAGSKWLRRSVILNRLCLALIAVVLLFRLFKVNIRGVELGFFPLGIPIYVAIFTGFASMVLRKLEAGFFLLRLRDDAAPYVVIAIVGVLLSLGQRMNVDWYSYATGPYAYLAWAIPPYRGMRELGRFGIMGLFAIFVMTGFAVSWTERYLETRRGKRYASYYGIGAVITVLISTSTMVRDWSFRVPSRSELPSEYVWLAAQPEDTVVLELPMGGANDTLYMYFALFHERKLINGYSGWFPPEYDALRDELNESLPSRRSATALNERGVDYILVHRDRAPDQYPKHLNENMRAGGLEYFSLVKQFENCLVFRTSDRVTTSASQPR